MGKRPTRRRPLLAHTHLQQHLQEAAIQRATIDFARNISGQIVSQPTQNVIVKAQGRSLKEGRDGQGVERRGGVVTMRGLWKHVVLGLH
jgi:hypothetical protein